MYLSGEIRRQIRCGKEPMKTLALAVLGVEAHAVSPSCRKSGTVRDIMSELFSENFKNRLKNFLAKYDDNVRKACNNRKYYLGEETEDCMQFVRLCLCKAFHKRNKYTNWDKVVRSIIKRKAIDFSKGRNSSLRNTVTETDLLARFDSSGEKESLEDTRIYQDHVDEYETGLQWCGSIKGIADEVHANSEFTCDDRRIVDALLNMPRSECDNLPVTLRKLFGGNAEANEKFKAFSIRVRRFLNRDMFF